MSPRSNAHAAREEAQRNGWKTYCGASCRRGHDGWRFLSNSNCMQCKMERLDRKRADAKKTKICAPVVHPAPKTRARVKKKDDWLPHALRLRAEGYPGRAIAQKVGVSYSHLKKRMAPGYADGLRQGRERHRLQRMVAGFDLANGGMHEDDTWIEPHVPRTPRRIIAEPKAIMTACYAFAVEAIDRKMLMALINLESLPCPQ